MKLSDLLNADIKSTKMVMDPSGHVRVMFDDEELEKVNAHLKAELDTAYEDWTPIWNESIDNLETYRCTPISIADTNEKSIYPAPIARVPADQIIASVYNAVMRPRVIFSIDAYLDAQYQVPSVPVQPPPGAPPPQQMPVEMVDSEDVAHNLQQGYEFVVRERIQLGPKLLKGTKGAVCGSPFWWKVVADPDEHTSLAPRVNGAVVDLSDKYEETRMRGDMVKWYLVPYTNGMMPLDAESINQADWFAERKPMRPEELAAKWSNKQLFLVKDDAEAETLANTTVDQLDIFRQRADQTTQKKNPSKPAQVVPNWLTWFYWDVQFVDPNDSEQKTQFRRLSLLGDFHLGSGKLMTCFMNPYEHQERPYELVDQMDDGDCTVGRLRFHQKMFTYAAQAEIKSAHIANNQGFWFDNNNPDVAAWFGSHRVITALDQIPGIKDKDWGTYGLGATHYSLLDLMKFYLSMSQLDSRENDFTMGGRPPGRTPAATVSQVYQHAEEVKTLLLARLSLKLSRLLRLDAETRRQYQPLGERIPVWNPESKNMADVPFRFPVGEALDNFRIALTAADQVLTGEKDPQQIMQYKQALMEDGKYIAEVIGPLFNMQSPIPASGVALFQKIAERDQKAMRNIMSQVVTDEEDFDLKKEIEAIVAERNQAVQAAAAAPPPPPPPPPKPETRYSISLTGVLPPDMVNQFAAAALQQEGAQGAVNVPPSQSATGRTPAGPPAGQGAAGGATAPPPQQPPVPVPHPAPPAPGAGSPAGPIQ